MIRIYSIQQALSLRGTIPELAIIHAIQFMGNGYNLEEHGYIIVMQQGDDITHIKEIGEDGLFVDEVPTFEFVEAFADGGQITFELVFQIDDSRTVAVFVPDEPWLDSELRKVLLYASPPPMPLPQIKEMMP